MVIKGVYQSGGPAKGKIAWFFKPEIEAEKRVYDYFIDTSRTHSYGMESYEQAIKIFKIYIKKCITFNSNPKSFGGNTFKDENEEVIKELKKYKIL